MQFVKATRARGIGCPELAAIIFLLMYSKTVLIIHTIAIKSDPKSKDPRLYLMHHQYPLMIEKSPLFSGFEVKYHDTTATISTYCVAAIIRALTQKKRKREYQRYPFCVLVQT